MNIALIKNEEGYYNLKYKNGTLVTEDPEMSYIKHNLLCFGRLNRNFTEVNNNRLGSAISSLEGREMYSTSWNYFKEGLITQENVRNLVQEFNRACNRDYNLGLFNKKIKLETVSRLDKETLIFTINVGGEPKKLTIDI